MRAPDDFKPITVYGTTWCRDCHLAKAVLKLYGVNYAWVDIDREPSAVELVYGLIAAAEPFQPSSLPTAEYWSNPRDVSLRRHLVYHPLRPDVIVAR